MTAPTVSSGLISPQSPNEIFSSSSHSMFFFTNHLLSTTTDSSSSNSVFNSLLRILSEDSRLQNYRIQKVNLTKRLENFLFGSLLLMLTKAIIKGNRSLFARTN
ncbi:unnamed protein product [Protopolystoma xenopodis]|uniref:Uncharacterized protein n=1 Tax=Protopolystoma xenopodis TaxID=117903 RepID=A0A3S5ALX9_9PLAT|nr:unnamed protein product [Protopolystoma xenopodis]